MKQHLSSAIFNTIILVSLFFSFAHTWPSQPAPVQAEIWCPLPNTIAQPQRETNTSNLYLRRDAQAGSKHLFNLAHESARYNRRTQFAQDKNLRDFFRGCSVYDLAPIFNYHLQNGDITEPATLKLYGLYTNPAFLAYITTLPGYTKHIGNLHSQAHHCEVCKKRITKQMRFNNRDAVMRFLDDAQQRICFAQAEQERRTQAAQQQVILEQQALAKNKELGAQAPVSKKYEIRHTTQDLIEKYGISARELTEFEGNQQQHILHARFIDIMDSAADLDSAVKTEMRTRSTNSKKSNKKHVKQNLQKQSYRSARKKRIAEQNKFLTKQDRSFVDSYKINSCFVSSCKALIIKSADIGIQSNKKGDTLYASKIADFCYVALDCAQGIALDIAIGTGEGVYQGVKNVGHMVAHPVDAASNIAHGAHTIVSHAYSTIIVVEKGEITFDFDQVRNLVIKKASQATVRGVARGVAEIVTETILTGKLCGVIAEFIESTQIISRTARSAARAVKALTKERPICVTSEGIEVYLVDGAGGAGKAGKHSVAKRANILKSEMDSATGVSQAIGGATAGKMGQLVSAEERILIENMHKQMMLRLEPEIARLRLIFDGKVKGFNEFANKYIKIDYKHILGMDLSFTKRGMPDIGGFHHDLMHQIEKCGLFEFANKVIHPNGFYSAEVRYLGHKVKDITFFPAHWSHEEVIGKIYEAYNNFIKRGGVAELKKNQKYFIEGITNEGVIIEMYVTKNGVMASAYPVLKKGI